VKVGVVGYGSIGQRHTANALSLGHQVFVYDPATRRDVRFERNIYETCDAVVIATPTWVHIAGIRACAERGRHMLVEKPIARDMRTLREMLDFAASKNLVVMVGNNLRFHPCVARAKFWIDEGHIGKTLWASFNCSTKSMKVPYLGDGVILNTGAHEVDLALHLLGPAKAVVATARGGEYGDLIADFVIEHRNGCRSTFHLDFVTETEIRCFRIIGEEGDLYCDLPARYLCKRQPDAKLPHVSHIDNFHGPGSYDVDYLNEMTSFIDRIEGKNWLPAGATGEEGFATLDLLVEVRKMAGLE
jgi:predicted dehydrogenase